MFYRSELLECLLIKEKDDREKYRFLTRYLPRPTGISTLAEAITVLALADAANASKVLRAVRLKLKKMQKRHPAMGDVRGLGLMIGIEFVLDRKKKTPSAEFADRVMEKTFEKGLMILTCGPSGIRLVPPLIIDRHECQVALEILDEVIGKVEREFKVKG